MRRNRNLPLCLLAFLAVSIGGCKRVGSSTDNPAPAVAPTATPTPATTPKTACTTSVIDRGQKGSATGVVRGNYTDVKLIPGSTRTAMAYADTGAISLKFTYDDGSSYQTEVISGEGAATWVNLVFKSDGTPVVLWVNGRYIKAAMRSAPMGSSGTWSAAIIEDTGATGAPRALRAASNPLDQIGAVYLTTNTAATGKAKFIYCEAPCTNVTSFLTMTPNPYIENANIQTNQTSIGFAWCKKTGSSIYYPAAVWGSGTNVARYGVCRSDSLSSCLSNSNWDVSKQVHATAAGVGNFLQLDPTVDGDVPKVMNFRAGTGLVPYVMGTTACDGAPVNFSAAGTTLTASTTTGSQWYSIEKDESGNFHLIGNDSTTSIRYYNSSTSAFSSGWNTHATVETFTVPTAAGGGTAIDTSTGVLHAGYGMNSAGYDVRLARNASYTTASNLAAFTANTPDSTGNLQLSGANLQQNNISAAITSSGRPAAAYIDFSVGAVANAKLKMAYRNGTSATSAWSVSLLPSTSNPQNPRLTYDSNDRPWIAFFEAATNRFYLMKGSSTDGSGTWTQYLFPALPSGAPIALPASNDTALIAYTISGTTYLVMGVIDNNATSRGLKVARFNTSTSTWSAVTTVAALSTSGASDLSFATDGSSNLVLSYRDNTTTRALYAHSTDGVTWTTPLVVSPLNGQGAGVRIGLSPSGTPALAYFDRANNMVLYSSCSGTPATCATSGWSTTTVDTLAGVSGLAARNEQLLKVPVIFSSAGWVYLLYPRGATSDGNLTQATNYSGSFSGSAISSGTNAALLGAAGLNFGVNGWTVDAVLNSYGGVTAVHLGPGNYLYSTSCGD